MTVGSEVTVGEGVDGIAVDVTVGVKVRVGNTSVCVAVREGTTGEVVAGKETQPANRNTSHMPMKQRLGMRSL